MFSVIEKVDNPPKVRYNTFKMSFSPYCIRLRPNVKAKRMKRFKKKMLEKILKNERVCIKDEEMGGESYEELYGEEPWFKSSLFYLGEEKFLKELKRLYCTPLMGQWTDYYINLRPNYVDSAPHYAHVRFKEVPSMVQILYAHSRIWQNFYREKGEDIKRIDHYYDGLLLFGNISTLIIKPFMSS